METMTLFVILICLVIFTPLIADLIVQRKQARMRKLKSPVSVSLSYVALFDGLDLESGPASANPSRCLFLHPFEIGDDELHHHSLNGCSFCKKQFRPDKDLFFYCDMRFCSQECRFEKMVMDEKKEKEKKEKMEKKKHGSVSVWFKLGF